MTGQLPITIGHCKLIPIIPCSYTQNGDKVRFQPFEKAQFMTF